MELKPNILLLSLGVFALALIGLVIDWWALRDALGLLEDGVMRADEFAIVAPLIVIGTAIATMGLTGLVMVMRDLATDKPGKSEVYLLAEKILNEFALSPYEPDPEPEDKE